MAQPSPFHIRIVQPNQVGEILALLSNTDRPITDTQALQERCNFRIAEPLLACRALGLVEKRGLKLSAQGRDLALISTVKPGIFSDIVHYSYYSLWCEQRGNENRFSWSYATLCNLLWEANADEIDKKRIAAAVASRAMQQFQTPAVSFSENSVTGALNWLKVLQPTVISEKKIDDRTHTVFTRRTFCSPEIFALAVDYLYQVENADYQTNLLLDPRKQETVCKVCLLEPTAFDAVLDWAAGQYDFLRRSASGGWGSYILLTRQPQIQDFLG